MYTSKEMRRFNHLVSETDAAYHKAAVKLGLSDSGLQILYTLVDSEGCCLLRDVCRLTGISKQTIHSAIHKLEQDGVLCVEAAGAKNRLLRLTEAGERLAAATVLQIIEAENDIFASWTPEEVTQYLSLTQRYLETFRQATKNIKRREPG